MQPNFSFLIQGTSNKLTVKIISFLTLILLIYLFEKKKRISTKTRKPNKWQLHLILELKEGREMILSEPSLGYIVRLYQKNKPKKPRRRNYLF